MKKLLFYINTIERGGAERVITNLAKQFAEHGYEVFLVTSYKKADEYSIGNRVKRIVLLEENTLSFFKKNCILVKKLRKILSKEKPDVVISFMREPNLRTLIAGMGIFTKKIISIRSDPRREYGTSVLRILAKSVYVLADGIVLQTEEAKQWFPKKIQKKSVIIPNQINEKFFNIKYRGERKGIVTVGRLTNVKNHRLLIEAFAKISDEISDDLFIYGSGELKNDLEEYIKNYQLEDRVFLKGEVSNIEDIIKSAKLFVLSSDSEGMPNALMEAMALGLPCISTDCPCGGPRFLFGNKGGICVPVRDADELAKQMLFILKNSGVAELYGRGARDMSERFRPEIVYGMWEKFCLEVSR